MKILVMNCGSSTLKFEIVDVASNAGTREVFDLVARGSVDPIGPQARIDVEALGKGWHETRPVVNHDQAARIALDKMRSLGLLKDGEMAVGHRVIHGADKFDTPVVIDNRVIDVIDSISELAPLHNKPALQAIVATRDVLGPQMPMIAVFDTAFHQNMPEYARMYAIDRSLADKYHARRYGFHGLAHRYMMERYCFLAQRPPTEVKIITLQLGNGCSATAIMNGKSVDTSMGFTPLEGLIMGTRSGDVDPSLAVFLAEKEKVEAKAAVDWLNTTSGLLGVSGLSSDMRQLLASKKKGDRRAALAIEMFCYRIKKYVGAYMAALGGAEALVFGGGIGENSPEIRELVCSNMDWCGLKLDSKLNLAASGMEADVSSDDSGVRVYVIPVDEASVIAREVLACLKKT